MKPGDAIMPKGKKNDEPTIAPGMNTHDQLEEKPTEKDRKKGETTKVSRLYLDRTPKD